MSLTEEPMPRQVPRHWSPYVANVSEWRHLPIPEIRSQRTFADVLTSRRSNVGGPLLIDQVGDLLWHAAGTKGYAASGRAGVPIEWRASPSAGGLHPISLVCVPEAPGQNVFFYDGLEHRLGKMVLDADQAISANAADIAAVLGHAAHGWTIRLIADFDKTKAAYDNAWSLILRDAGCLIMTLCLVAEWLGLRACPLGFMGQRLCSTLGFPNGRFKGVGAIQISQDSALCR